MAAEIEVVVRGEAFVDAYTRGDNRLVVATDTMKNFIHAASQDCPAATLEGWLHHVGGRFLVEYPHMERLTMVGRELPFPGALVPADDPVVVVEQLLAIRADWPHWRDRAVRDARHAQRWYGPHRFHQALADDLGALSRTGRRRIGK